MTEHTITHDKKNQDYFNSHTPVYSEERYTPILNFMANDSAASRSFVDVGCGTGNIIFLFSSRLRFPDTAGIDVSQSCLETCCRTNPNTKTYLGSILQPDLRSVTGRSFGFVLVGAVLHHLVGSTRPESFELSRQAIRNSWSLVEPNGCLVVFEPTFKPKVTMSLLFYVKRLVSRFTNKRVSFMGYWNNFGEPVVSYMSHEHVLGDLVNLPGNRLELEIRDKKKQSLLRRLCGITERSDSIFVLRKLP